MAQTQIIQRKIRSVKNAKQITKAMEVVAAARMRKVQSAVERVRAYGEIAASIMGRIATTQEAQNHPYFKESASKNKLYVVFSSDRGLAGAFNSNVFNAAHKLFFEDKGKGVKSNLIIFGRKGTRHFSNLEHVNVIGDYEDTADVPEANLFAPVIASIEQGFNNGDFGQVILIFTEFKSSLTQVVKTMQLLPIQLEDSTTDEVEAPKAARNIVYDFEPSIESVLDEALRLYFEAQLMRARVESATSEYAMRMLAMGNANRNASDLIDTYTLELNATRQAAITQEIAEITGGAAAIGA